jgi:uncharacterized protein YndB with AHSA1/START domain
VFQAFADPTHLAQWWGPRGFTNTFREFDLRPGGAWRFVMHGPDGANYPDESVFVDVSPPERVVFKHVSGPQFEMTITFSAHGADTLVGWRQVFDSAAEYRRIAQFAVEANEQNLAITCVTGRVRSPRPVNLAFGALRLMVDGE